MKHLGFVEWFDVASGEGMIRSVVDGFSYYIHWSAIQDEKQFKLLEKFRPVEFTLYTNIYMSQVHKCRALYFDYNLDDEKLLQELCNYAWENSDTAIFSIQEKYYK